MGKYIDGINEERFEAFLSDLRSGNYKQGLSALHTVDKYDDGRVDERFCCLGVACIRPAAEGVITVSHPDSNGYMVKYDGYNATELPDKVADYLGIPQANRVTHSETSGDVAFFKMGYGVDEDSLDNGWTAIGLNDRHGKSFEEIADAFENEFKRQSKYIDGVNEENMDRFLAALRSGEFKQGKYALSTEGNKFCCMGVMSELAHQDGVVDKDDSFYEVRYGGKAGLPVTETLDWLGIPESHRRNFEGLGFNISMFNCGIPNLAYKDHVTPSELNDARGLSFAEIADAFEQEFTRG